MDRRAQRVVENETRFREVNERIRDADVRDRSAVSGDTEDISILCECADGGCTQAVRVPLSEYERTRAAPAQFLIAPGHELPEFEKVVRSGAGYEVVEKLGDAKQLAVDADPRDGR